MKAAEFGVKHKTTGLFFAGFDANNAPIWSGESNARRFDKSGATCQALLFVRFGIKAQQKPVAL